MIHARGYICVYLSGDFSDRRIGNASQPSKRNRHRIQMTRVPWFALFYRHLHYRTTTAKIYHFHSISCAISSWFRIPTGRPWRRSSSGRADVKRHLKRAHETMNANHSSGRKWLRLLHCLYMDSATGRSRHRALSRVIITRCPTSTALSLLPPYGNEFYCFFPFFSLFRSSSFSIFNKTKI